MAHKNKYVVISPVRDEERFIEKTITSVIAQTIAPVRYIIVDDGSHDRTGEIIDSYANKHTWITAVHRKDRGFRNSAGGEVQAFYAGFEKLDGTEWDFVIKLDGDLSFDPDYFEKCLARFDADPKLGMGSGVIYNLEDGKLMLERTPLFHVRGAAKMYRKECWIELKGMYAINGWDTLDEVKANMLGWKTRNFADIKIVQHRTTGMEVGIWKNAIKNGIGAYVAGYHPLYMVSKCFKRAFHRPFFIESAGLLVGFCKGYLTGVNRVEDANLIRYLRRQQMNRLFLKPTIWK
jgi:glycosyltransferase involved in cell wall biosynthesis